MLATEFYRRIWYVAPYPADYPAAAIAGGNVQPIGFALPSPTDVLSSLELSQMLLALDPASDVTYSVVSPYGLVTYGATAAGLKTIIYENGNPRGNVAQAIVTRVAIRRMAFNIASTIRALGNPSIGKAIAEICLQASDADYRLSFTPF